METRDSNKMEAAVPESEIAPHGEYCLSCSLSPPMTRTQYNSHLSGGECAGGGGVQASTTASVSHKVGGESCAGSG